MAENFLVPGVATTEKFRTQEVTVPSTGNVVEMENVVLSDPVTPANMASVDASGKLLVNNFTDPSGAGDIVRMRNLLEAILLELQTLNSYILQSGIVSGSIQSTEIIQSVQ